MAGLRPQLRWGALEAQSAWQRGLLPQWLGRLPTPSACRRPPKEGTERKGRACDGQRLWSSRGGQATLAENPSVPRARVVSRTRAPQPAHVGRLTLRSGWGDLMGVSPAGEREWLYFVK